MSSQTKQTLTWGGLLIFFGVMGLAQTVADLNEWAWVALLSLAGLIILGVYLTDRSEWALLIPVYVMWTVAGLIALITLDVLRDEAIATYVLTAIALPFLIVFLRDRSQQWALTPAYVLLAVGIMVGLIGAGVLNDLLIPSYVMFAIAIPFLVVFARNPKQWWPLIPGGILAMIGASFLVAEAALEYILPVSLIIAGIWIVARQWLREEVTESNSAASEESESALTEQGEVIIDSTPDEDATG
jgi:hypothetical protein